MNTNEELYDIMDDTDQLYAQNCKKKYEPTLEGDLLFLQFVSEDNEYELKPDCRLAKFRQELLKYGLEITPETDLKQLAVTVKLLGLA